MSIQQEVAEAADPGAGGVPRAGAGHPRREGRRADGDGGRADHPRVGGPGGQRRGRRAGRRPTAPAPGSSTGSASTARRVAAMADGLRQLVALPDPVGEVVRGDTLANGLELRQVRVPFGVVGMIYEARPNVTVDAAGICLKSGNAVLLRGSSSARSSNEALVDVIREAVERLRAAGRRRPAGARRHPRERQGADARPRPGRRAHPARRRRPDPVGRRGVDRAR